MKELIPPIESPDGLFHDGNPLTGELGTIATAKWLNDMQEATQATQSEILTVLESAGMSIDLSKKNQLLKALNQIIAGKGFAYSDVSMLSTSAIATEYFGSRFWVDQSCPSSFTLPDISNIDSCGQTITIWNVKDTNITISVGNSSNSISIPMSTVKSLILKPTESATFIVEQNKMWHATGDGVFKHSIMFSANLAQNGWKREPSGLLTQWGSAIGSNGLSNVTFPIAFSNRPFTIIFGFREGAYPSYAQSIVLDDTTMTNLGFRCRTMMATSPVTNSASAYFWRAEGI
ncbi:gp53-like domain-containing protein [Limnobaculum xujianqingii]|uniref:gp53-like domain-containing protein n=1 Tax=Limnobaculum xujianqingii TaxID=2738837 RepID=UPI001125C3DC|nr:hypothetical protein [Limnobaculum xujianqingii]